MTVVPIQGEIVAGDIVLFSDGNPDRYIVHRVWKVKNGEVLTWGDNCSAPDGWIPLEAVLGKIVLIERGKRTIHPKPQKGLRWARFWRIIRPGYRFYQRIRQKIARRIKKWRM